MFNKPTAKNLIAEFKAKYDEKDFRYVSNKEAEAYFTDWFELLVALAKVSNLPLKFYYNRTSVFTYIMVHNTDSDLWACIRLERPYIHHNADEVLFACAEDVSDTVMKYQHSYSLDELMEKIMQITTPITHAEYVELFLSHQALQETVSDLCAHITELENLLNKESKQTQRLSERIEDTREEVSGYKPILSSSAQFLDNKFRSDLSSLL